MRKPRPLAVNNVALFDPVRSVQFSSVVAALVLIGARCIVHVKPIIARCRALADVEQEFLEDDALASKDKSQ